MALSRSKIAAALARAGRRDSAAKARQIQGILRAPQLRQPPAVQDACATIASGQIRLITALNAQIAELGEVVAAHFGRHRDADIYASQPGLGVILSARVLAEFGDDPHRVRRRQSTQELRRHLADHPSLRHQKDRPRPLRPQPAPGRRPAPMGVLLDARLTRRQGLLPGPARTRDRPPGRPPPARQPPRRNPARMPQDPDSLRRNHRLGPPHPSSCLTSQNMGCLPPSVRLTCQPSKSPWSSWDALSALTPAGDNRLGQHRDSMDPPKDDLRGQLRTRSAACPNPERAQNADSGRDEDRPGSDEQWPAGEPVMA